MLKMKVSACIDAPVQEVWATLSDLEKIPLWAEAVKSAHCPAGHERGLGAERICQLKGSTEITEKWIQWEEGHSFTYTGHGLPLVASARNTWYVTAVNGKTLITSKSEIKFKGGPLGILLEPLMLIGVRKMASNSLAAFRYLVEQGKPFTAKHSLLPHILSTC